MLDQLVLVFRLVFFRVGLRRHGTTNKGWARAGWAHPFSHCNCNIVVAFVLLLLQEHDGLGRFDIKNSLLAGKHRRTDCESLGSKVRWKPLVLFDVPESTTIRYFSTIEGTEDWCGARPMRQRSSISTGPDPLRRMWRYATVSPRCDAFGATRLNDSCTRSRQQSFLRRKRSSIPYEAWPCTKSSAVG
jgi:hypothetical protein